MPEPTIRTVFANKKATLLASGVIAGLTVFALNPNGVNAAAEKTLPQHMKSTTAAVQHPGFADMIESVRSAVVNISTSSSAPTRTQSAPGGSGENFNDPNFDEFMRRFFGQPGSPRGFNDRSPDSSPKRALGSGFIVDSDGLVVTNRHVVEGADEITVVLEDGTELEATLKGLDDKTDLALLEVESDEALPWVAFADSDVTRVGDWVIAIGNPFGLGGTATTGIVSARGRDINSGPLDDYIQIDAPINRGNSGGPLFNASGQVIGVNTAIYSPNGGSVGIGFAIPADQASYVVSSLKENGFVTRGYLGVHIQQMTDELAEALGLDDNAGALVAQVQPESPAEAGGILAGDVIVRFGDEPIELMRELPHVVSGHKQEPVEVEVVRDQKRLTLTVTPNVTGAEGNQLAAAETEKKETETSARSVLGLALSAVDEDVRQQSGLRPDEGGVVVADVARDGPSAAQGIRPGDVITAVGAQPINGVEDLREQLDLVIENDQEAIVLKIVRQGNARFVAVPVV